MDGERSSEEGDLPLHDEAKLDAIAACVEAHWPETIEPGELGDTRLIERIEAARAALYSLLDLGALA